MIFQKKWWCINYFQNKKRKIEKTYKRFPKFNQLIEVKKFIPSRGNIIFFQSTPNFIMVFLCLGKAIIKEDFLFMVVMH